MTNMYNVFIKKRKIRRYVVRPKSRGKDNIRVCLQEIYWQVFT
jgi:hypothetical protein